MYHLYQFGTQCSYAEGTMCLPEMVGYKFSLRWILLKGGARENNSLRNLTCTRCTQTSRAAWRIDMSLPGSPGNYRRGNSLQLKDKPKDFILISEFSELIGPVAVVSVVL